MANYRKSFNLRNGVQVDDDNFVVNANGLVGIGTSVPTEFLDVRGNAKVVGHTTSNTLYAGIATIGNLRINQGINASGVITAASFSGSASGLTGIYAIAVDGWFVNSSNSSITTSFKVGIGTTNPQYALQVGNPFTGKGVYIDSNNGNIFSTGGIGATIFTGDLDSSYLTGTIDNDRLPSNISVGIVTASSGFYGSLIGTASTANSITNTANIQVRSINSGFSTSGISTIHTTLHVLGNIGVGTLNPNAQIHLRKSGISSIQLTSDGSNSSIITFGRSVTLSSNNAQLRFGNTSGTFPDSTQQSLDVINYDTGNLNFYLNPGGAGTGSFNWFKPSLSKSMTLTSSGNLGINSNSPSSRLSVVGDAHVSGATTVGILTVNQSLTVNQTARAKDLISDSIQLNGSSSGYTKIIVPATAPSNTLTLPTNNGSSGQFLKTDGSGILSWGSAIGQIIQETHSVVIAHTTSWGETGLSTSITPASINSKIVVLINQPVCTLNDGIGGIRIAKRTAGINTETLYDPGQYSFGINASDGTTTGSQIASLQYVDTPSTTSEVTYFTEGIADSDNQFYSNSGQSGGTTQPGLSQIILIELL